MSVKLTYEEIEKVLLSLDEIPDPEEDDVPGNYIDYLLGECRPEQINDFLKENGFIHNELTRTIEVNVLKLTFIKKVLKEIETAYSSLDKEKPETYYLAYPIFGQWGLLSFTGVNKHPHFSDDGVEYASGYILKIILGIEKCLKNKKKVA